LLAAHCLVLELDSLFENIFRTAGGYGPRDPACLLVQEENVFPNPDNGLSDSSYLLDELGEVFIGIFACKAI
jgi:hypothetical protein